MIMFAIVSNLCLYVLFVARGAGYFFLLLQYLYFLVICLTRRLGYRVFIIMFAIVSNLYLYVLLVAGGTGCFFLCFQSLYIFVNVGYPSPGVQVFLIMFVISLHLCLYVLPVALGTRCFLSCLQPLKHHPGAGCFFLCFQSPYIFVSIVYPSPGVQGV